MARKKIESIVCDRCGRTVKEFEGDKEEVNKDLKVAVTIESNFGDVTFEDLCDKCEKRVSDLITQIMMEPKSSKDEKKAEDSKPEENKTGETPEVPEAPEEANDFA